MEAHEAKRKEYKDAIKDISSEEILYIDESGIEERIVKDRGWGKKVKNWWLKKVVNIMNAVILYAKHYT